MYFNIILIFFVWHYTVLSVIVWRGIMIYQLWSVYFNIKIKLFYFSNAEK